MLSIYLINITMREFTQVSLWEAITPGDIRYRQVPVGSGEVCWLLSDDWRDDRCLLVEGRMAGVLIAKHG